MQDILSGARSAGKSARELRTRKKREKKKRKQNNKKKTKDIKWLDISRLVSQTPGN